MALVSSEQELSVCFRIHRLSESAEYPGSSLSFDFHHSFHVEVAAIDSSEAVFHLHDRLSHNLEIFEVLAKP